ncbi:endonuclease Q family protein [Thermosulfuriphilus sp.]
MMRTDWQELVRKDFFLADLHIHSRYSRATSRQMTVTVLDQVAKDKGLTVLGTGDFTHPGYLEELERELVPLGDGLFVCRNGQGTRFLLSAEISNIFSQGGRTYRIHTLVLAPDLTTVKEINRALSRRGNLYADGRPIFGFPVKDLARLIREINPQCLVIPAHAWTPWFSVFGAASGFNSLEEAFEEEVDFIYAIETGLSSDPEMNWRLSALDRITLISNSDAHSPAKIGREANAIEGQPSYETIARAIRQKELLFTVEFYPEEGKYHYDGHRACGIVLSPKETRAHKGLCPVCGQPLTIGVMHRVEELADRPEGFRPQGAPASIHLVPLLEIIAEAEGLRPTAGKVAKIYKQLISLGGSEFDILLRHSYETLASFVPERILEGIRRVREGRISVQPGYDGLYGVVRIFEDREPETKLQTTKSSSPQLSLF